MKMENRSLWRHSSQPISWLISTEKLSQTQLKHTYCTSIINYTLQHGMSTKILKPGLVAQSENGKGPFSKK